MNRIDVGGHHLRVESAGIGPPEFVCLHGLVDTLEIWDKLAEPLGQRGRVTRFDQRGHGESDAPPGPYALGDLADDVAALLDRLEIARAVLVGHSLGGVVSLATAVRHPERVSALLLIGSTSQCSEKVASWYERIARAGERDGNEAIVRSIYGEKSHKRIHGSAQGIAHVTRCLQSLHRDPLTPKLSSLRCPALLLVGDKDPMGTKASEIIAARLADATFEVVPGHGHWLQVAAPDRVIAAFDAWCS